MDSPLTSGFRVTARDLEMLCWIGRQRFAEAGQVARRFAMDERNTYRRLRGLVRGELLEHRRVFHAAPGVYIATRFGLAAAGLVLPPARLDIRTYVHDRTAVALMTELEAEFGREALRTERELRSHDAGNPGHPKYAVRRGSDPGRRGLHFPDLAVERDGNRPLAVEVELTAKGATRLDSIVRAYVRGRQIASVRYYAAPAALVGVQRAVARATAQDIFDIRKLEEHESCSIPNLTLAAA